MLSTRTAAYMAITIAFLRNMSTKLLRPSAAKPGESRWVICVVDPGSGNQGRVAYVVTNTRDRVVKVAHELSRLIPNRLLLFWFREGEHEMPNPYFNELLHDDWVAITHALETAVDIYPEIRFI